MKAHFALVSPDSMSARVTLVMTVGEWKQLKVQLADTYPSWKLASVIRKVITAAEQTFQEDDVTVDF